MKRSSRRRPRASGRAAALLARLAAAASSVGGPSGAALAHPMLMTSGEAHLDGATLFAVLGMTDHDLTHMPAPADGRSAFGALADELGASIAVLDDRGGRLEPDIDVAPVPGGARCELRYALPAEARFLTFQQRAGADARAGRRLIEFQFTPQGSDRVVTVRLSAGGNAETIDVRPERGLPPPGAAAAWMRASDRFTSIYLVIRPARDRVSIEARVPAPLLQAWLPSPASSGDRIEASERDGIAAAAAAWVESRVRLDADGEPRTTSIDARAVLRPDHDTPASDPSEAPACFWSARLVTILSAPVPADAARLRIEWSGFNSGLLAATAVVEDGGSARLLTLTPRTPSIELARPSDECPSWSARLIDAGGP